MLTFGKKTTSNIFSELAESPLIKLPNATNKYLPSFYCSKFITDKSFHLSETTEERVLNIMQYIEISKAGGVDKFSGTFLKDGAEILAKSINEICNLSITFRTFPNACKVSKLKPIFKKAKQIGPCNYRPILLLPLISKILETVIYHQTNAFFKENSLLL